MYRVFSKDLCCRELLEIAQHECKMEGPLATKDEEKQVDSNTRVDWVFQESQLRNWWKLTIPGKLNETQIAMFKIPLTTITHNLANWDNRWWWSEPIDCHPGFWMELSDDRLPPDYVKARTLWPYMALFCIFLSSFPLTHALGGFACLTLHSGSLRFCAPDVPGWEDTSS